MVSVYLRAVPWACLLEWSYFWVNLVLLYGIHRRIPPECSGP
jgi:hypothetical protein